MTNPISDVNNSNLLPTQVPNKQIMQSLQTFNISNLYRLVHSQNASHQDSFPDHLDGNTLFQKGVEALSHSHISIAIEAFKKAASPPHSHTQALFRLLPLLIIENSPDQLYYLNQVSQIDTPEAYYLAGCAAEKIGNLDDAEDYYNTSLYYSYHPEEHYNKRTLTPLYLSIEDKYRSGARKTFEQEEPISTTAQRVDRSTIRSLQWKVSPSAAHLAVNHAFIQQSPFFKQFHQVLQRFIQNPQMAYDAMISYIKTDNPPNFTENALMKVLACIITHKNDPSISSNLKKILWPWMLYASKITRPESYYLLGLGYETREELEDAEDFYYESLRLGYNAKLHYNIYTQLYDSISEEYLNESQPQRAAAPEVQEIRAQPPTPSSPRGTKRKRSDSIPVETQPNSGPLLHEKAMKLLQTKDPKMFVQAFNLLKQASDLGYFMSSMMCANMLLNGTGIPKNENLAKEYSKKANDQMFSQ